MGFSISHIDFRFWGYWPSVCFVRVLGSRVFRGLTRQRVESGTTAGPFAKFGFMSKPR